MVKQFLPPEQKEKLILELSKKEQITIEDDLLQTHIASEAVLAKDWLNPKEDEIWKDL